MRFPHRAFWLLVLLVLPQLVFAANIDPFNLTPPPSDLSVSYLAAIFGNVNGVLHSGGSQILGKMFAVFNSGVLLLGALAVTYTLFVGTLRTAHEGETLGKNWSSIWIPLRTAIGIALLLPKSSGYSAIQIFVMWVIVQGVGLADNMWDTVVNYLHHGGMLIQQTGFSSSNIAQNMPPQVGNILQSEVCMAALQKEVNLCHEAGNPSCTQAPPNFLGSTLAYVNSNLIPGQFAGKMSVKFPYVPSTMPYNQFSGACGKMIWNQAQTVGKKGTIPAQDPIYQARNTAVLQVLVDMSSPASLIVSNALDRSQPCPISNMYPSHCSSLGQPVSNSSSVCTTGILPFTTLGNAALDYQAIMYPILSKDQFGKTMSYTLAQEMKHSGWILAGAFIRDITQANANVRNVQDTLPEATPPSLCTGGQGSLCLLKDLPKEYQKPITNFTYASTTPEPNLGNGYTAWALSEFANQSSLYSTGCTTSNAGPLNGGNGSTTGDQSGTVGKLMTPMTAGLSTLAVNLSFSNTNNINPFILLSYIGSEMVNISITAWFVGAGIAFALGFGTGAIPCVNVWAAVTNLLLYIVPLCFAILLFLCTTGAILAFYVPMIPYILYIFQDCSWFIAVIVAMVAAPIIAFGILIPEGQHEVFGKSEPAIIIIFSVFLRPALMVFALIVGTSLAYVMMWLINKTFAEAFHSIISQNGQLGLGWMIYPIFKLGLYTTFMMQAINLSYGVFPQLIEQIWRVLGGHGLGGGEEGTRALGEVKSGAGEATGAFSKGGGGGGEKMLQSKQMGGKEKTGTEGDKTDDSDKNSKLNVTDNNRTNRKGGGGDIEFD